MVVGTIGYMSPEQSEGRSVGPESDVFAWGVLAREMLTGVGPLGAVPGEHPPVPAALTALVRQTLDADPAKRPRSAEELLTRLAPIEATVVVRRNRRALPVALVVLVVLTGAVVLWATRGRVAGDAGVPSPVAVAPLVNETGDTALTIWGRMAADWLTQGLHETSLVHVVPWPTTRHAWDRLDSAGSGITPGAIAEEVGGGTIVTGAYYLNGDRVTFRIDVTDARRGRLLASLPAVVVARDSLEVALRELRDRLMGFVALQRDERVASLPGLAARPPRFSAYRAFDRGLELYNEQEYAAAATEFRQAWTADTTFPVPLIYAAMAHWNQGQFDWVDTLVSLAERARDRLSEYDRLQLEYLSAILASDGVRAIAAATRAVEIAPESRAAYNLGRDLLAVGRAAEGRQVLERIDPNRGMLQGWSSYWTQLAHARHLTGAHDEERRAARTMRERFPDSRVATVLEARALAAAGNMAALDSLLAHTALLPAATYWSHAAALVVAGEELVVHHDSTRGWPYLERAIQWLRAELRADPGRREHRYWLGSALYDLAQWREAEAEFAALNRDFPDRLLYQGLAALGRARVGDAAGAERVLGPAPPVARSDHTMYRARLAAIAGDSVASRTLRQQALGEIAAGYAWLHASAFRDFGSQP
jgi:serine/threonine-protein kinase